jgi:hypothetical protein
MINIILILLVTFLSYKTIKEEQREYKQKYGMSKKDFLALRKQMNPQLKITLKQRIQDLSKN